MVLTIVAVASVTRFGLDTDFVGFLSLGTSAEELKELNEKYHVGETISILIESATPLLAQQNLEAVCHLQERIRATEGISQVESFVPSHIYVDGKVLTVSTETVSRDCESLADFLENRYAFADQFLSSDRLAGMVVATPVAGTDPGQLVHSLRQIIDEQERFTLSLAGDPVMKDTFRQSILKLLAVLPPLAFLLILVVFSAILRRVRFALWAAVPAVMATIWTLGTLLWTGHKLDLVTAAAPLFILVIGSAYGLHYVSHFVDNAPRYADRRQLTVETMRMVGVPMVLATITTMVGFASLTWTNIGPMRNMGIFTTLGIGYAGLIALFLLPAALAKVKVKQKSTRATGDHLTRLVQALSKKKSIVVIVFLAIVVVSIIQLPQLKVKSDPLMFFKDDSEIVTTFDKVDTSFGGAFPLTVEMTCPKGRAALRDCQFASEVLATERELEDLPGITSAFSVFDMIQGMNMTLSGNYEYPQDIAVIEQLTLQIRPKDLLSWVSRDGVRVVMRTQDLDSQRLGALADIVDGDSGRFRVVAGLPVLWDELNNQVVQSQTRSLALALALIFLMLMLSTRRLSAALAGLLPVLITIIAILGFLSLANFHLNMLTATLSAICIGVGVDYSIHLISGIHQSRKAGMTTEESVDASLARVSKPILANGFGVAIGFSVLLFGPLKLYYEAGIVLCLAMVLSSLAALFLIPIFYRSRQG